VNEARFAGKGPRDFSCAIIAAIAMLVGAAIGFHWAAHDASADLERIKVSHEAERADWQSEKESLQRVYDECVDQYAELKRSK
jgi:hypothetical protein